MTNGAPDREQEADGDLTGFWTGVFDTADLSFEAMPFHAFLHEEGGAIRGEAVEPNAFSPDPIQELFASLEGWRDQREIEFVKTYEDAIGAGFAVRFEGVLDRRGDRIEGVWSILGARPGGSRTSTAGPFVMNRASADAAHSVAQAARRGA